MNLLRKRKGLVFAGVCLGLGLCALPLFAEEEKKDFQLPSAFSKNKISIQSTPSGWVYQETFSDTTNPKELRHLGERFIQGVIPKTVALLRGPLFKEESSEVVEKIQRHVMVSVLGYFDEIWHGLEEVESKEKSEFIQRLIEESTEFLISQIDQWWRAEGRHYPQIGGREQVEKAFDVIFRREEDESWMEPYRSDFKRHGGAYLPLWVDRTYPFKFSVTMPAPIVESNATQVKGNTAIWEFDPLFFLLKDYTLKAGAKPEREGTWN